MISPIMVTSPDWAIRLKLLAASLEGVAFASTETNQDLCSFLLGLTSDVRKVAAEIERDAFPNQVT